MIRSAEWGDGFLVRPAAARSSLVTQIVRAADATDPTVTLTHRVDLEDSLATVLPRKEVIQPQLPLRLPCYDFVPITGPTLGRCLLAVGPRTSGVTRFHDVTGGVYKAREHIHRRNADRRLLATPPSWGRVAAPNLN